MSKRHSEGKFANAYAALSKLIWYTNGVDNVYISSELEPPVGFWRGRTIPKETREKMSVSQKNRNLVKNHKVSKIEKIHMPCKVYDLTIEDNPNFALAAGVFVHNSKDMADAVCGALFNASQNAEQFAYDYGEMYDTASEVNSLVTSQEAIKHQITVDFEEELKSCLV